MTASPMETLSWWVLAQNDRLGGMSQRFQSGSSHIHAGHVVFLIFVLLAVVAVLWKVARVGAMREGRSYDSARCLFRELCRHHALDWQSRKLLRKLARSCNLEHPAQVFLEPTRFEAPNVSESLQPFQTQLARLKDQLFASDLDVADPARSS